ncbi:FMN-dependent NADH-azoreductase [Nesterenkonia haasae]|uniref:FMN-dependent NADH-azoreductase n=1 Tax=Nesterenkonia haasae TaxID=2587813 RepID=UPI0013919AC4|nr:NAD(P)H-dependent oxidoreductase [Nesterenkonia haasae]NDK30840.1 flavodoxin family protein [Nesterenkonia haasae]
MSLLRIDASIRHDGSVSRALADIAEAQWLATATDTRVVRREIGTTPLPSDAWAHTLAASATAEDARTLNQQEAFGLATTLVDELAGAGAFLFAVPLYNFGVSQHFKTYTDLVIADARMNPALTPVTAGKPGVLVTVQGGNYSPGTPKEGWDHATAWMRRILEDVWQIDLEVVTREFTLVGVNPALDAFTDMAEEIKTKAEDHAHRAGRKLAEAQLESANR